MIIVVIITMKVMMFCIIGIVLQSLLIFRTGTDFSLALKYTGLRTSIDYTHSAKLISPPVQITSDSCIAIILMANANFTVSMAYLNGSTYMEHLLLSSPLALGRTWHRLYLNASPMMTGSGQFVLVLESAAASSGTESAMINDIKLLNGTCRDLGQCVSLAFFNTPLHDVA